MEKPSQQPDDEIIYTMERMDEIMSQMPGNFKSGGYLKNYLREFELWKFLYNSSTLQEHGITCESPPKGSVFAVQLPTTCSLTNLFISSKGDILSGFPDRYEIAFYNNNDEDALSTAEICFSEIREFSSEIQVHDEILRISSFTKASPKK